jgi:required for meiotic nuclear division protein 1
LTAASEAISAAESVLPATSVRALLIAERLDTRALERDAVLGSMPPLAIQLAGGGIAVAFRYGAVVLFDCPLRNAERVLARLEPLLTDKFPVAEQDELKLLIDPNASQLIDATGNIILHERSTERLQLVADVLAKNLILSHYETRLTAIFDGIEPLAATLREKGRAGVPRKELLQHIGTVLLIQQKMVGRAETSEKPELVWDHPELDRLYMRLAEEYELRERGRAIDRKLEIVSRTVETLVSLEHTRSSLRLEWYIVALIVAEVIIAVYSLFPIR